MRRLAPAILIACALVPVAPARAGDTWPCGFSLVSASASGRPGNEATYSGSISRTGRYVVFTSYASNLVPGDDDRQSDVFLRDRVEGTIGLVGRGRGGVKPTRDAWGAEITPDGRYLAFATGATNVHPAANGFDQIYRRNLSTGGVKLVSRGPNGAVPNMPATLEDMSADGRYLVFSTPATNLTGAGGDRNAAESQVYLRDVRAGRTRLVSVGIDGGPSRPWGAAWGSVSDDGRHVAFVASGSNLVAGDTNDRGDIFVRDLRSGRTRRISVKNSGAQARAGSMFPRMTPNGRRVLFTSSASLVRADTNGADDAYVWDRRDGLVRRVSLGSGGVQPDRKSVGESISDDGRYVTFTSHARNLDRRIEHRINGYARDLKTGRTRLYTICDDGTPSNTIWQNEDQIMVSGNGTRILLASQAMNWAPRATSGLYQIYERRFSVLPPTLLTTEGPYGATFGQPEPLGAHLTHGRTKDPVAGATVSFALFDAAGARVWRASAQTGADGSASVTLPATVEPGTYRVRTAFGGDTAHAPVQTTDRLDVASAI